MFVSLKKDITSQMMAKPVIETENQTVREKIATIEDIMLKISVLANKPIL